MATFIERCLLGDSSPEDIDTYIDQWHEGNSDEPLGTFLGLTPDEYRAWVERPDVLASFITAHRSTALCSIVLAIMV